MKADDQPILHVERYLLNRFGKDVLLKTVFELGRACKKNR
jgi:hypothetical protein